MIDIIPAIFEKDKDAMVAKIELVAPHVDWVQIDIADGSLMPVESFRDVATLKEIITKYDGPGGKLSFEAHLMVASPEKYILPLVDAGFKRIVAHVECNDPRFFLDEMVKESVEAGHAIDGGPSEEQIEPYLESLDVVLVMMAEAGASGLALQTENVEKIRAIHASYPDLSIAAEEGIDESTAAILVDAGATRLVASSVLYKNPEGIASFVERFKKDKSL